ncbi:hypothetical protein RQP46_005407 [Phenoliferia psychrophenolica]
MIVTKATRLLKPLLVLGLESSADDTCASVVSSTRKILSSVVLKQGHVHEVYGGIHPLHAQEAHQANMGVAIRRALQEAQVGLSDLDGIAFTRGPGMHGCLGVCAGAAKALAGATGLPLLGVHHMQAHALTPLLTEEVPPEFPFLTLLVSGGHTLLVLARSETSFKILATCDDESIGAAFDKACRDLRIPYSLGNNGSPGSALEAFSSLPSTPLPTVSPGPFSLALRNQLAFSFADNAAMIASVGLSRLRRGRIDDLTVMQRSKWSIEECEADFGIESID